MAIYRHLAVLTMIAGLTSGLSSYPANLSANETFTDDLTTDSLYLWSFTEGSGGSVSSNSSQLTLRSESVAGELSRAKAHLSGDTDSVEISVAINSASNFTGTDKSRFQLFATLFNDTQSGGHDGFDGDIVAGIQIRRFADGSLSNQICMWRRATSGEWLSASFFNGNTCTTLPVLLIEDQQYDLAISVDRANGLLTYQLAQLVESYPVVGAGNYPSDRQNLVETSMESLTGQFIADISSIKTDQFDSTSNNTFKYHDRYHVQREEPGEGNVQWSPDKVRLKSTSNGTAFKRTRLRVVQPTDILQANISIDSASVVASGGSDDRYSGGVTGMFYNDVQDGGFNGLEGDIFATSELLVTPNGGVTAQYCALRSTSADFTQSENLLNGGQDDCLDFQFLPVRDTFYTLSVGIDRPNKQLVFTINDETAVYNIQTAIFIPNAGNFRAVRATAYPDNGGAGTSVVDVDQIETQNFSHTCNNKVVDVYLGFAELPTAGADVILGTAGNDIINALGGDDTICGLGGNDTINAGGGDDWVDGGDGDDDIQGSAGNDDLFGGIGNDVIRGGSGDDDINGEEGDDTLIGQPGDDTIDGGDGVDDINGGGGNDTIYTGSGATVGSGVFVSGSGGNDTIYGGPDADDIKGSTGADTIYGHGGNDVITGGNGRDIINGGDGNDDIKGQESRDTINGDAGDDIINGGAENDTVNGGSGDDDIIGGPGNDVLRGDSGTDSVKGGSGDDTLVGGASSGDVCNGQSGIDTAHISCESAIGIP